MGNCRGDDRQDQIRRSNRYKAIRPKHIRGSGLFNKWINVFLPTCCLVIAIVIKSIFKDDTAWGIGVILSGGLSAMLYAVGVMRYTREHQIKVNALGVGIIMLGFGASCVAYCLTHLEGKGIESLEGLVTIGAAVGMIGICVITAELISRSKVSLFTCLVIVYIIGCCIKLLQCM